MPIVPVECGAPDSDGPLVATIIIKGDQKMFTELAGGTFLLLLLVVTITDLFAYSEARSLHFRLRAIAGHLEKIEKHIANMNDRMAVGGRTSATPGGG
jgi:hypothetical protein